ncbi:MAG: hypothetical protein ABSB75_08745, partial [Candidatus Limnocylindrales bacterium]
LVPPNPARIRHEIRYGADKSAAEAMSRGPDRVHPQTGFPSPRRSRELRPAPVSGERHRSPLCLETILAASGVSVLILTSWLMARIPRGLAALPPGMEAGRRGRLL